MYDSLLNTEATTVKSAGLGLNTTGTTTSNVTTVDNINTDVSDFLNNTKNSATELGAKNVTGTEDVYGTTDIFNLLSQGGFSLISVNLGSAANHNKAVATNTTGLGDSLSIISEATTNIYTLLDQKLTELGDQLNSVIMAIEEGSNNVSNAVDNAGSNIGGTFWASI